jgi:hypothetical protein
MNLHERSLSVRWVECHRNRIASPKRVTTATLISEEDEMPSMNPKHSSRDYEESNTKYHNNSDCPHYHELRNNGHVAEGTGNHPLCDWCATH